MRTPTITFHRLLLSSALLAATACGSGSTPDARSATSAPPDNAPAASASAATTASASGPAPATSSAPAQAEPVKVPPEIQAVVDAKDRSDADRALDKGRHPAELLAFFGVKSGMKVAELFAGGGYTSELLARTVGPTGVVFGENNKTILDKFAEKPWSERLAKPVMKNVKRVDRELDDPLPPEAKDLDVVFSVLIYHDTVWMGVDRAKMNKAVFNALKPGGVYAVVDHSSREGAGVTEVKSLHRIEEKVVRQEVEAAGFKLAAEGSFLRMPDDKRDWSTSPSAAGERRGTSDRFVLKFVKPGG